MDKSDLAVMSRHIQMLPFKIDAKGLSICRRPRFWWFDWEIGQEEHVYIYLPPSSDADSWGQISFDLEVDPVPYLPPGWSMAGGRDHKFCTFTTSQPKTAAGFKPAGLAGCNERDLRYWSGDRYRFPPYQYKFENGIVHRRHGWKLPDPEARESVLGLRIGYTYKCCSKSQVKSDPLAHEDTRLTLLGNGWSVQVASYLMRTLCMPRGLCPPISLPQMLELCQPGGGGAENSLRGFLARPPWKHGRNPIVAPNSKKLISNLGHLVSTRGGDILLNSSTEPTQTFDRLRNSVPPHLWRWKTVCGWSWKYGQDESTSEHINKLELRSLQTSIKWRVKKQHLKSKRFLHLVDSVVTLHVVNKGRSSAYRLQRIIKKVSALLLLSHTSCLLGYVESSINPADAPSRRSRKRRWGGVA